MTAVTRVRRARAGESLDAVAALQDASFHRGWGVDALRREIEHGGAGRVYLLESDRGALIGFCACWVVAGEWHINSLAVAPEWRRQGHARRLLAAIRDELIAEGVTAATLEVRQSNTPALRLYRGLGFVIEGMRRNYYDDPREDALVLWHHALARSAVRW